jgi:hypothetical protein
MTTLRTSNTSSAFPRFGNRLDGIGRAVLEDSFPTEHAGPLGGDRHFATADFPRQTVAGANVE